MKNDYSRSIDLVCPVCAGTAFSFDEETPEEVRFYECVGCDGKISHQEILDSNQETISRAVDETKKEIISDIKKDFKKLFK